MAYFSAWSSLYVAGNISSEIIDAIHKSFLVKYNLLEQFF